MLQPAESSWIEPFAGGVGETSAQLFDWRRDAWSNAGALTVIRAGATATVLDDGQVLVGGGFGDLSIPWTSAERYDPRGRHVVAIGRAISAPGSAGIVAPLFAVIAMLALGLGLRARRRVRQSQAGVIWIE